jgi:hypothetical protein
MDAHIGSSAQAVAAALAVHESRVVAQLKLKTVPGVQQAVDDALFELEHRYWKLADEFDGKRQRRATRPRR